MDRSLISALIFISVVENEKKWKKIADSKTQSPWSPGIQHTFWLDSKLNSMMRPKLHDIWLLYGTIFMSTAAIMDFEILRLKWFLY